MRRKLWFGALSATTLATTAIVAPLLTSTPAWAPVTRNLSAAPAAVLPAAVDDTHPVSVVRTSLDKAGRPVITKHTTTDRAEAEALVRKAQKTPGAVAVEVDQPVYPLGVPTGSDPQRAQQWDLTKVRVPDAWQVSTGAGVTVAVLDTGVQASHPDLAGQVLPGWNAITRAAGTSSDVHGHGTHVAGTIAAATGNGVGVAGMAPDVKILPVKVLPDSGPGSSTDVASGIIWAADQGAQVINMSLGGAGQASSVTNAVAYARSKGVVVIAAAGNARAQGSPVNYPAADVGVIAVAATDSSDNVASFSNAGSYVDIAAPGVNILSTIPVAQGSYNYKQGTSMAAPHVAALAALLRAKSPGLTPDQVEQAITASAVDLGIKGKDNDFGYGRIDAVAALAGTPSTGTPTTPPAPAPAPAPPALPTPAISSDGASKTVAYNTALKTVWTVTKDGQPWKKLSAQLCTADGGAETFKCKKVTTSTTGTVTHSRKATVAQRVKLVVPASKTNAAAETEPIEHLVQSAVTLAGKKTTLTVTLTGAAKQVIELQQSADGATWTAARTFKASSRTTLTKVAPDLSYRVVVPDVPAVLGATSNTVQM